jgi:anti-sigma factor RsiW
MRCVRYRHLIDLLLDGALNGESVSRVEAHLAGCTGCRSYREQGLRLKQLIQSSPQPQFPQWLHKRVLHECQTHETQRAVYRSRSRLQLVPAAMAVMLSLFLGSLIGKNAFSTQIQTDPQTSQSGTEFSFGENTLVDSDYYSGGSNE